MTAPLFDRLPFVASLRSRLEIRGDASRHIVSQALDWPGVLLEAGRNYVTGVDAVALGYHYLGLNTDRRAIVLRGVNSSPAGGDVTLASGSVWIVPAGDPVTMTVDPLHACVRIAIDPSHAEALLAREGGEGGRIELRRTYGVDAPQLRHLMMALVAESDSGTSSGIAFVEALTAALSRQLVVHAGVRRPRAEPARGGLSPAARRRVLELIDAKLDGQLSVGTLAREAGLSPAHFARAFKESLGHPPHRVLLSRRLERARHMLEGCGAQLSDVAARAGFADQAHLTRHFKRRFGVTPGAVMRSTRRQCA
jgi:AraC-like DNA-binding protein